MKSFKRAVLGLVGLVVLIYIAAVGYMYVMQRHFEYDPSGRVYTLGETKLTGVQKVQIPTTGGALLTGWYHAPSGGKPLILYYKGNAGSFTYEFARYEQFEAAGYGFLAFDYRGFPTSPGTITEAHVLADALAAFGWAKAKGFPIVIWGRSLGSGPATYVASLRKADALLLETPFDSAVSVARDTYWYMPVHLLMEDQYRVDEWIKNVTEPVFVAHGTADTTIGVQHGRRVYALAPNKYALWIVPGGTHTDLWQRGLWNKAEQFFVAVEKAKGQ